MPDQPPPTDHPPAEPDVVRVPLTQPQACPATTALVWSGRDPQAAAVILAHGAGTDMHHHAMRRHAADLCAAGHAVALFNFAYAEAGRRRPDPGPRLESAWRDVITALRPHLGDGRRLVIGGRSMGGRIASMVAAADADVLGIAGVVCLAYPLHPPGRPDRLRVEHWPRLAVPILLVSGTRDPMAPIPALQANISEHLRAGIASLCVLDGADHSFAVRKRDGRTTEEVFAEAGRAMTDWLRRLG